MKYYGAWPTRIKGVSLIDGPVDGIAVVDKAPGWTSHDVVAKARGVFATSKVGHAGTLDPDATGVLLLGVGRATRLLRFFTALRKRYTGEVVLGSETTTLDASGEVIATYDMSTVTPAQVVAVASQFVGTIMQVPPMVSAVKVGGRRLHELAREGVVVQRRSRLVTVYALGIARDDAGFGASVPEVYRLRVTCSSGTFVRSLAADIGSALKGGAHLRSLRREAIGSFIVEQAKPVEAVELLSMSEAMRDYPSLSVSDAVARKVSSGQVLANEELGVVGRGEGPWAVQSSQGDLLAMYEMYKVGWVKPAVVIPQQRR